MNKHFLWLLVSIIGSALIVVQLTRPKSPDGVDSRSTVATFSVDGITIGQKYDVAPETKPGSDGIYEVSVEDSTVFVGKECSVVGVRGSTLDRNGIRVSLKGEPGKKIRDIVKTSPSMETRLLDVYNIGKCQLLVHLYSNGIIRRFDLFDKKHSPLQGDR